jgi:hypothetical protein
VTGATQPAAWSRRRDVLWRRLDAGLLVLPLDADEPMLLDGVAPVIWDLLDEPVTIDDAVSVLAEVYSVDAAIVEHDLREFLEPRYQLGAVACQ